VFVSVAKAEEMLNTEYHVFQHKVSGTKVTRSLAYSLPPSVKPFIDVIGPTSRFPALNIPIKESLPPLNKNAALCSNSDPTCLRALYQVGQAAGTTGNASGCVTGYLEQYISLTDLQTFLKNFDPNNTQAPAPTIIGPNDPSNPGIEASLDIQYLEALAHGTTLSFWYTAGRQPKNPENEPFLVWLQDLANTTNPPLVYSTSYGDDEPSVDYDYGSRVNTEFARAGARGLSILFASGDGGVSGGQSQRCTVFIATYPAASPYITAVGGTYLQSTNPLTEYGVDFSSGGFSNYWPRPDYQVKAVNDYLTVYGKNIPPQNLWNQSGRAFPDVAALGTGFPIVVGGNTYGVAGTSCSSPTFSALVTLLNDVRISLGKSVLGFLNPLIYAHPEAFNDITMGNNPGCGTQGFYAAQGWDPVTGYGTPNWPAWVKLAGELP